MVTIDKLDAANVLHLKELRSIRKMTDVQYETFKKNFTLGILDPDLSRVEAMDLLISMITVNRNLRKRMMKSSEPGEKHD